MASVASVAFVASVASVGSVALAVSAPGGCSVFGASATGTLSRASSVTVLPVQT